MQLVDEEHHVGRRARLRNEATDALLVVAAVRRAGEQRDVVDGHDPRPAKRERHVTGRETLREPLDDRGLAYAGRTHERGVVLAVAEEDVYHAGDLLGPAAHRLESTLACVGGQVAREARENAVSLAGHGSASGNPEGAVSSRTRT